VKRLPPLVAALAVAGGTAWAGPGSTTRLSAGSDRGSTFSFRPWMSADGRVVAYDSDARTLVPGDGNGKRDVFIHDRVTGTTERVSVAGGGEEAGGDSLRPTVSADGRHVAFWSRATNLVEGDTNGRSDAFVHDRVTGSTVLVSVAGDGTQGNGDSARPVISGDGRLVAFESTASNLVPGDNDHAGDVFLRDVRAATTTRLGRGQRPSISDDGSCVAFDSGGGVYVYDLAAGKATRVSAGYSPSISGDGRVVAVWSGSAGLVPGDSNGVDDVFVHDRASGETTRVSVASDGGEGDGLSTDPDISPDGRFVVFWSRATNLVDGDTNRVDDVFLHDRTSGKTVRVSVGGGGRQSDAHCFSPNVSAGGGVVAFDSRATTLVEDDPNPGSDVFVHTS
jgi:Tol biopolymer transport system component